MKRTTLLVVLVLALGACMTKGKHKRLQAEAVDEAKWEVRQSCFVGLQAVADECKKQLAGCKK